MKKYQLAKLISLAAKLDSRKRIQKIVFLLQTAGCEFELDYCLHHYGPYSFGLANLLNDLTAEGILVESSSPVGNAGKRYSYAIAPEVGEILKKFEETKPGRKQKSDLERWKDKIVEFKDKDLWELELGSTIAYFYQKEKDWKKAAAKACEFKKVKPDAKKSLSSLALAKNVVASERS